MIDALLPRYYEVMGTNPTYAILNSFVIEGHEVAWMEFRGNVTFDATGSGREGEPYVGRVLHCECEFTEGVGFGIFDGEPMGICETNPCHRRMTVKAERHRELREAYGVRAKDLEYVVFDLIAKKKAGEFLEGNNGAEFWGGYFYVQTLVAVTGASYSDAWAAVRKLLDEKKISLEGAVICDHRDRT